jgi:hypothetical protein
MAEEGPDTDGRIAAIRQSVENYMAAHPEDRGVSWPALCREVLNIYAALTGTVARLQQHVAKLVDVVNTYEDSDEDGLPLDAPALRAILAVARDITKEAQKDTHDGP